MKLRSRFSLAILAGVLVASAQEAGPDPREIPVPRIKTSMGSLPGVSALPVRKDLPDVMVMNDGTRVANRAQWEKRREEMKRILAYYAVGQMPPAPGNVKGKEVQSEAVLDGAARYRLMHLSFGPGERLGLDIGIFTPAGSGPFPAIILQGGTPPGGTVLPRLPAGPNQGKGEDVLMLVGPGPNAAAGTPPAGRGGPLTAQSMASQRSDVLRRGYAQAGFVAQSGEFLRSPVAKVRDGDTARGISSE